MAERVAGRAAGRHLVADGGLAELVRGHIVGDLANSGAETQPQLPVRCHSVGRWRRPGWEAAGTRALPATWAGSEAGARCCVSGAACGRGEEGARWRP